MLSPLARLFIVILFGSAFSSSALPPPGEQPARPPTLSQIWETADAIIYGNAVRIQADASDGTTILYDSTLRVDRCWKGDLTGDIRVEGGLNFDCYFDVPFRLRATYVAILQKIPGRNAYAPRDVFELRLPLGGPTPLGYPTSAENPFSLFGGSNQNAAYNDDRAREIFEFAERMASHEADVKRRHALRAASQHERERLETEHEQLIKALRADFQQAQDTELVLDRKHLLLALQDRIKNSYGADFKELKEKVAAELGAIEPLVRRGIKTSFPSAP